MLDKVRSLAVAALLVAPQFLAAQVSCCLFEGSWKIGADALYFVPIDCQYVYGVQQNPPTVGPPPTFGKALTLGCTADWGFRVFAGYEGECYFSRLSYQYFENRETRVVTGPGIRVISGPLVANDSHVLGSRRIEYQNVNMQVGKSIRCFPCLTFSFFGSGRWIDLTQSRRVTQTIPGNPNNRVDHRVKSQLQGGALGVGAGADVGLMCNFNVFGEFTALGVIAERSIPEARLSILTPFSVDGINYPNDICLTAAFDFRVGVNYHYRCGCGTLVGEIGYEMEYFLNAFSFPTRLTTLPPIPNIGGVFAAIRGQDFGLSGLFFGLRYLY